MIFIRRAIVIGIFLCIFSNLVKGQTIDTMFTSIIYNGITEKDGVLITIRVASTSDYVKIPFMLLSNRISEIEQSEDSILIKDGDMVLFDVLFGEPLLFYSDFFTQVGICPDSVQLRSNAHEYHIGRQIKELNFDIFKGFAHKIDAFIIQFEMSRPDIEKYIKKEFSINIYSALTRIPVGVLIDENSTLAELLRNKYKKF